MRSLFCLVLLSLFVACDDGAHTDNPCDPANPQGDAFCVGDPIDLGVPDQNAPDAPPRMLDICDGIDNDGDGRVDEHGPFFNDEHNELCVTEYPAGTRCREGRWTGCVNGVVTCVPNRMPEPEGPDHPGTCGNHIDEDCDGTADEGDHPNGLRPEALCDGRDDDCDGIVDDLGRTGSATHFENYPDEFADRDDCDTGLDGVCAIGTIVCHNGQFLCESNEAFGRLLQRQARGEGDNIDRIVEGARHLDVCDGLDVDCDGIVDEDNLGGRACDLPEGVEDPCNAGGVFVCTGSLLQGLDCVHAQLPKGEVCDNQDNDCDGNVDEGVSDEEGHIVGGRCNFEIFGDGHVRRCAGTWACDEDGTFGCKPMRDEDDQMICQ